MVKNIILSFNAHLYYNKAWLERMDSMPDFIVTPFAFEDLAKVKAHGADSVLIGTPFFSVRCVYAFAVEELQAIKKECERLSLRMYVAVNRFFVEEELPALRQHLHLLKELDVDGIYYGDECVLLEAEHFDLKKKLIYNPDTLITNHSDVQYYLDEGIQMVTISKEITLQEMCEIGRLTDGECEVILHGRLNMMHSKRNLLSSYMSFIGKNEQVRNNYDLYLMEENREEHMPIVEDETGTHVFTGFTLPSFEEIQELLNSGIRHFRIDGMFHDIAYVLEALDLYHAILNKEKDATAVFAAYAKKYEKDHVTHGFYYTKTSKVKEG